MKNTNPSSTPFSSTKRTDGRPLASAVASATAVGSFGDVASHSANHVRNWSNGSAAQVGAPQPLHRQGFSTLDAM